MRSIVQKDEKRKVSVQLTEAELRYLLRAGFGLLQHIPKESLPTYVDFSSDDIKNFSKKIKSIMDENEVSL